jgi:alkylation response protein AidB-like acyl-CoA dehydrogenase
MDFNLSEEQQILRQGAERYLAQHYQFEQRQKVLATSTRLSEERWSDFAELGWLAVGIPESHGGIGGSFIDVALLLEVMGHRLVLEPVATTAVLGARLLERSGHGSAAALLPQIAAGALRIALAHEESGFRSERARVAARARRDGAGFRLEGAKILSYDAPNAHRLIVSACEDGHDSSSLWLVDRDAPRLTIESYELIDGPLAADVVLDGVPVTMEARLAGPGTADAILEEALDRLTLARVAEALGAMEAVMQITAEQIRNRQQFGQPLAKFQALQHRMAEMFVEAQETRSILYHGLAHLEGPTETRQVAVSQAKVVASAAGRLVGGQGIQLHGGVGLTEEYAVGHYFRHLIALERMFGDPEFHLSRLAGSYG